MNLNINNTTDTPENLEEAMNFDIVVVGDEIESVLTAVSAARLGNSSEVWVALLRRSDGKLGGLSTRGGLSYMDITPEFTSPLFQEFLDKAGVTRVALNPDEADHVLQSMLDESGVVVISGADYEVMWDEENRCFKIMTDDDPWQANIVIDATPDGDVARSLGVPYIMGLGGLLNPHSNHSPHETMPNFLGVSPVFTIDRVSVDGLRNFEQRLRKRPGMLEKLKAALPYHPEGFCEELIERPTFAPDEMDYLDILNHTLGVAYHHWRYGEDVSYSDVAISIDGANISQLKNGRLGFNGLVVQIGGDTDEETFEMLLELSQGGVIPEELQKEMKYVERFLKEEGGFKNAVVNAPKELYVRQTCTLLSRQNMTARMMLEGGVTEDKAIGTFSYWLDMRGVNLYEVYPELKLPKPIFNVGLDVTLPLVPELDNFAFVSRSAGYSPLGQGAGRIVQHNAMIGEALGVAATLSVLNHDCLMTQCVSGLTQVQDILSHRSEGRLSVSGKSVLITDATVECQADGLQALLDRDEAIVYQLRESVSLSDDFLMGV